MVTSKDKLAAATLWVLITVIVPIVNITSTENYKNSCIELDPTLEHAFTHKDLLSSEVCIVVKSLALDNWRYGFSVLTLEISSLNENKYTYYSGDCRVVSKSIVRTFFSSLLSSLFFQRDSTNSSVHHLNPFQPSNKPKCIYLSFDHYSVDLSVTHKLEYFNVYYGVGLAAGYVLLKYAPFLARKQISGYIFGVLVGFFFSSIILSYLIYSFFQKNVNTVFSLLAGGTFLISSGMGLSLLVKYLYVSVQTYPHAVAIYACFTSFVSLAVVYFYEPFENKKILNLFQWFIQLVGVVILYNSSNLWQLSFLIIFVAIANVSSLFSTTKSCVDQSVSTVNTLCRWTRQRWSYIKSLPHCVRRHFYGSFLNRLCRKHQSKKFLTMDEYNLQGAFYTKKALENLRLEILSHPKNIQYAKMVSRPLRYIEFASGGDHLTDEERSDHASWLNDSLMCDDNESFSHIISHSTNASVVNDDDSLSDSDSLDNVDI